MTYARFPKQADGVTIVADLAGLNALNLDDGGQVFRLDNSTLYVFEAGVPVAVMAEATSIDWGNITGDIENQTDLDLFLTEIIPIEELVPLLDEDYEFLTVDDEIDGGDITNP